MVYTYKCNDCNISVDEIRNVCERDKPLEKECLACEDKTCSNFKRKKVNPTSFELKGNGFYSTDYKK